MGEEEEVILSVKQVTKIEGGRIRNNRWGNVESVDIRVCVGYGQLLTDYMDEKSNVCNLMLH